MLMMFKEKQKEILGFVDFYFKFQLVSTFDANNIPLEMYVNCSVGKQWGVCRIKTD